jgi:hypothetical protein
MSQNTQRILATRRAERVIPAFRRSMPVRAVCNMPAGAFNGRYLVLFTTLVSGPMQAQEALRTSMAGQAAAEARRIQNENLPYTIKTGDFRLLANASLEGDWNDNVYTSRENPQDDYILRPSLGLNASYPVTQNNLLQLNATFGYNQYLNHHDLSTWYLQSGSALSFDIYVKDFWINFHDFFSYVQDSSQEAAVANTGTYGNFVNTAGLTGTWDLEDVIPSLGYDHQNYLSTSSQFEYQDHVSEMIVPRVGLNVHPKLTLGIEGSASLTTYNQKVLNDNNGYSAGFYGNYRPGKYFSIQPRFGYTLYDFRQTSLTVPAEDQNAWYLDLTISHQPTEHMSYALSAGHELRLGIQSDAIEDWYVRPNITWNVVKRVAVQTGLTFEQGSQAGGMLPGSVPETYSYFGVNIGLSYSILQNATIGLNYRITLRSSDLASREYTQNVVGLLVSYSPK